MVTRVVAEFEEPELAEIALNRIKESVRDVYSTNMIYNKKSDRAERLRNGTVYTLIPTVNTVHSTHFMTAVMESPACEDVIPEPARSRKTTIYVVCEKSTIGNVTSILNSMGAMNIH